MGLFTRIENRLFLPIAARFRGAPVRGGAVAGLMVAALVLLCAVAVVAALAIADMVMKPVQGGLSLISAFLILPLVALAGMPWSYVVMRAHLALPLLETLIAGSVLLNGLIIGTLAGLATRLHARNPA